MTLETKANFARRMDWNRSSVTRAATDGRVVMREGMVDVEASLTKIEALASPYAHHRAHAQQLDEARTAKSEPTPPADTLEVAKTKSESIESLNVRLKTAEANKREHEADIARMDREFKAGNLLDREDVEFALDNYGATLRGLLENIADRMAPMIQPLQTLEEVHTALNSMAQEVLQTMHDQLQQGAQARRAA